MDIAPYLRSISFFVACLLGSAAAAAPPITVQGSMKNSGGAPVTGSHPMTFHIYGSSTGGTQLWSESHATIAFTNGIYSEVLGNSVSLDGIFGEGLDRWLAVTLDGGTEFSPRQQMSATPYALHASKAATASSLDGATSPSFALVGHTHPRNIIYGGATGTSTGANDFMPLNGGSATSAESRAQTPAITNMIVTKILFSKNGIGTATLTLWKNGVPTTLSVTASSFQNFASATGSVAVLEGDLLSLRCSTGFPGGISYSIMAE